MVDKTSLSSVVWHAAVNLYDSVSTAARSDSAAHDAAGTALGTFLASLNGQFPGIPYQYVMCPESDTVVIYALMFVWVVRTFYLAICHSLLRMGFLMICVLAVLTLMS